MRDRIRITAYGFHVDTFQKRSIAVGPAARV
jgi:hypothetical protein